MHVLVTGHTEYSSNTACGALQGLDKPAIDSDQVEGLANWFDLTSHSLVKVTDSEPLDIRKIGKFWNEVAFQDIMATHKNLVLCGSANNQLDYYRSFEKVIFLDIPSHEQTQRLHNRAKHEYDNNPELVELIVRKQAQLLVASRDLGAIIMNANRPIRDVTNDIIRHLK